MANKIIHKLFPSPVFQFKIENHEEINKQLIEYIYGLKKEDDQGIKRSNVNGWHSKILKLKRIMFLTILLNLFMVILKKLLWMVLAGNIFLIKLE